MVITITSPNQIYIAKVRNHNIRDKMITTIAYSTLLFCISICLLPAVYTFAHAWVGSCTINVNSTCIQPGCVSSAYRSDLDPVSEDKVLKSSVIQKDTPFILPFP
ncbi:MAG: hypothetical protein JO327_02675 [Nitrososphaeraceae archaeon]|nr:hypothetical protein [Nitrososphaeraceae archaeon]MBV9667014.1 hypothetical protein [Nitrososphaeraceae archaeon]